MHPYGESHSLLTTIYTRTYECITKYIVSSLAAGQPINTRHDIFLHQPHTANYNQRQLYHHGITTQQALYINDYYKAEVEKCGIIHGEIPSPDKKKLPKVPLGNVPYYRKKNPTGSSGNSLKTETRNMYKLNS